MTQKELYEERLKCPVCGTRHSHPYYTLWKCPHCQHTVCTACKKGNKCWSCRQANYAKIR